MLRIIRCHGVEPIADSLKELTILLFKAVQVLRLEGVELLGEHKVARRLSGFEWGNAVVSTATSAPWLDASASVRGALGPNRT